MISVANLGTLDYPTALQLQRKLVELRKENRIGDTLLLLEHPPVITLGRNAKAANILASAEQLSARGVEVFESDRGGNVTFHGPGQVVGYPIFDLRTFSSVDPKRQTLGVIEYVRRLEEVLIRTCSEFGISTQRICRLTGVWTHPDRVGTAAPGCAAEQSPANNLSFEAAKIAAIGIHISRSITSHGFALNVDTDLDFFNLIIPCGIVSKPVTSMAKELGRTVDRIEVTNAIVRTFGEVFDSQILFVENIEDLLNPVGVPLKIPANLRTIHRSEEIFPA